MQMDAHGMQWRRGKGSGPHYTFDTNVMLRMVENANFLNMLKVRMNFRDATIHFDDIIRNEMDGHGCPVERVMLLAKKELGVDVLMERTPLAARKAAASLERAHPTLHSPDSYILAGCIRTNTILVSRDRGLILAARNNNVKVVNPDTLATGAGSG
jgi:hypothetical protein